MRPDEKKYVALATSGFTAYFIYTVIFFWFFRVYCGMNINHTDTSLLLMHPG